MAVECIFSSKSYDKRAYLKFEIVNFPFLGGDVSRSPSYGVYISQLIRFARVCSNVDDFNNRNLFMTAKLLKQSYILKQKSSVRFTRLQIYSKLIMVFKALNSKHISSKI